MRTVEEHATELLNGLTTLSTILAADQAVGRDELLYAVVHEAQMRQMEINTLLTCALQDIDAILGRRESKGTTEDES